MSLETMSFILGGILLGAGLFGGGLEIKELKLPQIGVVPRVLCSLFGAGFVALAVFLNPRSPLTSPGSSAPPSLSPQDQKKVTMSFPAPMLGDMRLDACFEFGQQCGEPAATAWCKTKGMTRAVEFTTEVVGARGIATRVINTNRECKETFCASFASITCEK